MPLKASAGESELDPISSPRLEIARLARGVTAATADARLGQDGAPLLKVGLHRGQLNIGTAGGYFTLKMMLVRALRRSLKTAIIEVDDAEGPPDAEEVFELTLDPPDAGALGRARKVVKRVLRARRWQAGLLR